MGIFFRPRRPLMRVAAGATTAAVAYHMGKKGAQQQAVNQQAEAAYAATQEQQDQEQAQALAAAQAQQAQLQAQLQQMQMQQAQQAQAQQAPAAPQNDPLAELERLAKLHTAGVLDDAEFAAMKAKLIGG